MAGTGLFPDVSADVAGGIVQAHGGFVKHPEPVTATVQRLCGRPALPFARWARDHANDFRADTTH